MNQISENEMFEHHDHAAMAMNSGDQQIMSESEEANFSFHCDYCGLASIVLIDVISLNQPVLAENSFSYKFLLHSTPNNSLFRPPISA